jgi:hypothetical protein
MSMTLPYPYEVETGQLKPRPPAPRAPFDIAGHLEREIRPAGSDLLMFGKCLQPPPDSSASEAAALFRHLLRARFAAWRPNADAATWELFESQAHAEAENADRANDALIHSLLLTINGL